MTKRQNRAVASTYTAAPKRTNAEVRGVQDRGKKRTFANATSCVFPSESDGPHPFVCNCRIKNRIRPHELQSAQSQHCETGRGEVKFMLHHRAFCCDHTLEWVRRSQLVAGRRRFQSHIDLKSAWLSAASGLRIDW